MAGAVPPTLREQNRQHTRDMVLDAAERLLKSDTSNFSMRALAAEAGVGFATPFNHFGSKAAIMQALSARLIVRMAARFAAESPAGDAIDRVFAMGRVSVALLLEKPDIHKAVVGSLGVVSPLQSAVRTSSQALWAQALGDYSGLTVDQAVARTVLAGLLAYFFRGCLSFWIAGELADADLETTFRAGASTILLGFAAPQRRPALLDVAKTQN